jgi:hypothetical protein
MEQLGHRAKSARSLGCILLFAMLLMAEAVYSFHRPKSGLDTVFYVSLLDHGSQEAFRSAVASCDAQLPVAFNGCDSMQDVRPEIAAYNSADYATMLRFYTVKPLYLWVARLLAHLARGNGFLALRLTSVGSYIVIGLMLALWLRRHLSTAAACMVALLLATTPQVLDLAKWLLPDGLSLAVMLPVIYLVLYVVRGTWLRLALLAILPLARPDNLLFCVLWAALLLWRGSPSLKVAWPKVVGLLAGAVAYNAILGRATHALSYTIFFTRSFLRWTPPATYPALQLHLHDYLRVVAVYGTLSVVRYFAFTLLFAAFALASPTLWRPLRDLLLAALAATFARLLLFPGPEERYYVWLLVIAAVCAAASLSELLPRGSWFRAPEDREKACEEPS